MGKGRGSPHVRPPSAVWYTNGVFSSISGLSSAMTIPVWVPKNLGAITLPVQGAGAPAGGGGGNSSCSHFAPASLLINRDGMRETIYSESVPIQPCWASRNSMPVFNHVLSPLAWSWPGSTRVISVQWSPPSSVWYSALPWLCAATPVETSAHPSAGVVKLTPMTTGRSPVMSIFGLGVGEELHRTPPSTVRMIEDGVGRSKSPPSQASARPGPKNQSRLIGP